MTTSGPNQDHPRIAGNWLTRWLRIFVFLLVVLIGLKVFGVEIIVQVDYDGNAFLAALTEIETYYLPLGVLLVYFVLARLWSSIFGSRDS